MKKTIIKIENLTYKHQNGEGIENISFELESGDFLAVIGKSGAGKSTLINSILGILKKDKGSVKVASDIEMKDISFSPQNQAIDWYLDVFDNVYMGALFDDGNPNRKSATLDALKSLGLDGKEKEEPANLSGGQLQRLQLARQMVLDASILILDEPTSSLDVITSEKVLDEIRSKTERGNVCLVSSHDLDMLEKYCNKVLLIDSGKMEFFGTLQDFLKQYQVSNEVMIISNSEISSDLKENLESEFDITSWEPLCIELKEGENINSLLNVLIENNIVIDSVQPTKKSLKEIILLKG